MESSNGIPTEYYYDNKDRIRVKAHPDNRRLHIYYDEKGKVLNLRSPIDQEKKVRITHQFTYAMHKNTLLTTVRDAENHRITYLSKKRRPIEVSRYRAKGGSPPR